MLNKHLGAVALILMVGAAVANNGIVAQETNANLTIKDVMQRSMKDGLAKKVAGGQATADEKQELVQLFEAMSKSKPPRGDEASWKEKTTELVAAAKGAVAGDSDAGTRLSAAINCGACHKAHK